MPNIVDRQNKDWPGQLVPIILAGGSGSRLAPLSTPDNPKQFLRLFNGKTLLQQTIERAQVISTILPVIVTTEALAPHVRNVLLEMKLEHVVTLCEPSARGTAASVMLVTRALGLIGDSASNATFLVMPSDHHFLKPDVFYGNVKAMYDALYRTDKVGLFGIRPDTSCVEKSSDYGFVLPAKPVVGQPSVASNFIEKPKKEIANTLRDAGALWNSGIFIVSNSVLQHELNQQPKLGNVINSIMEISLNEEVLTVDRNPRARAAWNALEILSLDNMLFPARSDSVARCHGAVLSDITASGWSDVGTWEKLFQRIHEIDPDEGNNTTYGQVHLTNCENCLVFNESSSTLRVRDQFNSIIISTLLNGISIYSRKVEVADKTPNPGITEKADLMRRAPSVTLGSKTQRPWGSFDLISQGPRFKAKHLHVNPQSSLSLQVHQHRKEQWIVVIGSATVILGGEEMLLQEGDSVTIDAGVWHRLENRGKIPLLVIEVQTGPYLEEDDITRRS